MKIRILGGGPAGLYFAALMKRQDPSHDIVVYERSPRDATWGFGVVFSDRALEFLRADDEAMYQYLMPHMETWPDLTIAHNDTRIAIAGNGFADLLLPGSQRAFGDGFGELRYLNFDNAHDDSTLR